MWRVKEEKIKNTLFDPSLGNGAFCWLNSKINSGSLTLSSCRLTRLIYSGACTWKFHTLGWLCNFIVLRNLNGASQWASARGRDGERVADRSGQDRLTVQRSASAACTILSQSAACQSRIMISPRTRLCACGQRCDVIQSCVSLYPKRTPNCTMTYCTRVSRMTNGLVARLCLSAVKKYVLYCSVFTLPFILLFVSMSSVFVYDCGYVALTIGHWIAMKG